MLKRVHTKPWIAYSDAEWTIHANWIATGIGGIIVEPHPGTANWACALANTPWPIVSSLAEGKTQIIPLELLAAASTLQTQGGKLRSQ